MFNRKNIGILLNLIAGVSSTIGVILALVNAKNEGFSSSAQRLLYFTNLSNIWIGVTCLVISIISIIEIKLKRQLLKNYWFILKYIFTVSITITGLIFCVLLAPFAEFNVWTFSSILTHVVVPTTSIASYFVEVPIEAIHKKYTWYTLIPPLLYFIVGSILSILKVDFGRGQTYPYFFMNYYSEVGLFGFRYSDKPEMGSFYWIIVILLLIIGLSKLYYKLHSINKTSEK